VTRSTHCDLSQLSYCDAEPGSEHFLLSESAERKKSTNLFGLLVVDLCWLATASVLFVRYGFNVGGIAASAIPAKVIENQSLWNGTDMLFVLQNMCADVFSVAIALTITLAIVATLPNPTRRFISAINLDVLNARLSPLMPPNEAKRLPTNRAALGLVAFRGKVRSFAASAKTQTGRIRTFKVRMGVRHLLTPITSREVRRARSVDALPGFSLSQLYHLERG
jgi:hypothetical protein